MNVNLLIDAIVHQTMILIAQLATAAGGRARLAHVANQVFLDLVGQLADLGLGRKVIADMFGVSLRTYHARVQRLSESATEKGLSLWEAVYAFVREKGPINRIEVLSRFRNDDEATVRGVLRDLVESGLVFSSGRGHSTVYRAADDEDLGAAYESDPEKSTAAMVWVAISSSGPIQKAELANRLRLDDDRLDAALASLLADGRITEAGHADGRVYSCDDCVIGLGAEVGWEAALFDHFQAVVTAMASKVQGGSPRALPDDTVGGCTYEFEVWDGHPLESDVLGLLGRTRTEASELRQRIEDVKAETGLPDGYTRVLFYAGQTVVPDEE